MNKKTSLLFLIAFTATSVTAISSIDSIGLALRTSDDITFDNFPVAPTKNPDVSTLTAAHSSNDEALQQITRVEPVNKAPTLIASPANKVTANQANAPVVAVQAQTASTEPAVVNKQKNDDNLLTTEAYELLSGEETLAKKRLALNLAAPIPPGTLGGGNGNGGPGSSGPDSAEPTPPSDGSFGVSSFGGPAQDLYEFAVANMPVASGN